MTTFCRRSKDEATRVFELGAHDNYAHYMDKMLDVGKNNSAVTKKNSAVTVRIRDGGRKAVVRRRR